MGIALRLYENLTEAGEDKGRARLIAEAFEQLEDRYPEIKELATQSHVRESELRLQKEIKEVEGRLQLEIKEVEGRLQLEIRETEGRLQKEIEGVRLDVQGVRLEIEGVRAEIVRSAHRQTLWMIGAIGAIVGLIRLMDFFLQSGVAR